MENELSNISSREFSSEKKGYNRKEVRDFLDFVSIQYENKIEELKELKRDVNQIKKKIEEKMKLKKMPNLFGIH